ncbi:hypothetical protein AYI68_g135 [Smittium mucronatum]|uniref:SH3 domain-containing protein n=1 Tax=Smittium mucronatum TaxID=133383 RepID=A0A1R0H958_9FUNG|nr:hypothetical protein AYI68_g135 [Smittium mucronatum]
MEVLFDVSNKQNTELDITNFSKNYAYSPNASINMSEYNPSFNNAQPSRNRSNRNNPPRINRESYNPSSQYNSNPVPNPISRNQNNLNNQNQSINNQNQSINNQNQSINSQNQSINNQNQTHNNLSQNPNFNVPPIQNLQNTDQRMKTRISTNNDNIYQPQLNGYLDPNVGLVANTLKETPRPVEAPISQIPSQRIDPNYDPHNNSPNYNINAPKKDTPDPNLVIENFSKTNKNNAHFSPALRNNTSDVPDRQFISLNPPMGINSLPPPHKNTSSHQLLNHPSKDSEPPNKASMSEPIEKSGGGVFTQNAQFPYKKRLVLRKPTQFKSNFNKPDPSLGPLNNPLGIEASPIISNPNKPVRASIISNSPQDLNSRPSPQPTSNPGAVPGLKDPPKLDETNNHNGYPQTTQNTENDNGYISNQTPNQNPNLSQNQNPNLSQNQNQNPNQNPNLIQNQNQNPNQNPNLIQNQNQNTNQNPNLSQNQNQNENQNPNLSQNQDQNQNQNQNPNVNQQNNNIYSESKFTPQVTQIPPLHAEPDSVPRPEPYHQNHVSFSDQPPISATILTPNPNPNMNHDSRGSSAKSETLTRADTDAPMSAEPNFESIKLDQPPFKTNPGGKDFYVKALYDYKAEEDVEISLVENCLVKVIEIRPDGWWKGSVTDAKTGKQSIGLFPSNYTSPIG